MAFLKTLLIIIATYLGLKLLWRFVKPYFLKWLKRKAERHFTTTFGQNPFQEEPLSREGEVTIDRMPETKKKRKAAVGQYVDYEEID